NDCLNLPPHHLTRWNKTSLEALTRRVGLKAELLTPKNHFGLLRSILYTVGETYPDLRVLSRLELMWRVLGNRELRAQTKRLAKHFLKRPRLNGNLAGNVVLAVCTVV